MLVCQCMGTSDRDIRQAVREGARDASDVGASCEAGTDCGGCLPLIDLIVEDEREALVRAAKPPAVEAA